MASGTITNQAFTYAPDAFTETSALPIATLTAPGTSAQFSSLAVGASDRLYSAASQQVDVFDHPHNSASAPSATFVVPSGPWVPVFEGALAFDEHDRFYGNLQYLGYCNRRCSRTTYRYLYTDFDKVLDPLQSSRKDRVVDGTGCKMWTSAPNGWLPGQVTGMAVYGGYIDAACTGETVGVWVFRADSFSKQKPVEELLVNPTDAKIGP